MSVLSNLSLLVASPALKCPYFGRTVVLVVEHKKEGSIGFVINRQSDISLNGVIEQLGLRSRSNLITDKKAWLGGPVAPNTGWLLYEPFEGSAALHGAIVLTDKFEISTSKDVLNTIANGLGPSRHMLLLGCAGWGANQLDTEIQQGSWLPVNLSSRIVFDLDPEERWAACMDSLGIDPIRVVTTSRIAEA